MTPSGTIRNVPMLSSQRRTDFGDNSNEQTGAEAAGSDVAGEAGCDDVGQGKRTIGAELPPSKAATGSVRGGGGWWVGASATGPAIEPTGRGGLSRTGAGALCRAVRGLWPHVGSGEPGGRGPGGAGSGPPALAPGSRFVGASPPSQSPSAKAAAS